MDTKTDPRLVVPPKMLRCENATFAKTGGVQKRHGYNALSRDWRDWVSSGGRGTITDVKMLATLGDELLSAGYGFTGAKAGFDPTQSQGAVFSYSPQHDRWVMRGPFDNPSPSYEQIPIRNSFGATAPPIPPPERLDFVEAFGYRFVAWGTGVTATTPLVSYAIYDIATGAVIEFNKFSGTSPKWSIVGGSALLFYTTVGTGTITCQILRAADIPAGVPTNTTIGTDGNITAIVQHTDTASGELPQALLAYRTLANDIKICYVSEDGIVLNSITVTIGIGLVSFAVDQTPNGTVVLGWSNDSSATVMHLNSYAATTLALIQAVTLATGGAGSDAGTGVALVAVDNTTVVAAFGSTSASPANNQRTFAWAVDVIAGTSSSKLTLQTCTPQSRLFLDDDGLTVRGYFATVFIAANPADVLTQFVAVGISMRVTPASLFALSTFAYVNVNRNIFSGSISRVMRVPGSRAWRWIVTTRDGQRAASLLLVTHDFGISPRALETGQQLLIAGAVYLSYDGENLNEAGFLTCPHFVTGVPSTAGGALTSAAGTIYSYKLYWERTDAKGHIIRSTFGAALTVTMGAGNNTITLTFPSQGAVTRATDAIVGVYRAGPNPTASTAYHRVSSVNPIDIGLASNPYILAKSNTDILTFVDGMADATANSQTNDYTFGGVADNAIPGGGPIVFATDERAVLAGTTDDPTAAFFSKLRAYGDNVDFNNGLSIITGDRGGHVAGGGAVAQYVVILKEGAIYAVTGDGPNNTQTSGGFSPPKLITNDLGCVTPASVVNTPVGLMFEAQRGIYVFGPQGSPDYVGAPVEGFLIANPTITSAVVVPGEAQVRFLCSDGDTLVYDYEVQAWSSWTNHRGTAAVLWMNVYTYVTTDGEIRVQSEGFTDPGNRHIPLVLETPWIRVAGPQGYQKARRLHILGEYRSPHIMQIQMAYDYDDSWVQIHSKPTGIGTVLEPGLGIGASYYGEGAYYGSNLVYGGSDVQPNLTGALDDRMKLNRQKCQAVRFRWEDVDESSTPGESFSATVMSVEIGGEPGRTWPARQEASG